VTEKRLRRLFADWQGRLGLASWEVVLDFEEPCSEVAHAVASRPDDYDRATIRFDKDWKKWSEAFSGRIVVHELLHLLTRDIDRVVADLEGELHKDAYTQVDRRYSHEIEGLVDRLAVRLVELLA
jgi:hypothetical protein